MVRDENGRFVAGHEKIGGRKRRADEDAVKAALRRAMPETDVLSKLSAAIDKGEPWAIQLYLAYMWGKPIERVNLGNEDGGPLEVVVTYVTSAPNIADAPCGAAEGDS